MTPLAATHDVAGTVAESDLVVVSVPASVHETWVAEVAPALRAGATILFMGEGSGSLVAHRVLLQTGLPELLVGETNCLQVIARAAGRGAIVGERKTGRVLLAAIPSGRTDELAGPVRDVWPFLETAGSVFETALVNYDAIDIVPVALTNAATLEGRPGGMLLWGEGATRSVV